MRRKHKKSFQEPSHHLIVENGDWSQVLEARKAGVSWDNLRTRNGMSALGMAIFGGSALATQTLLEMGAPVTPEELFDKSYFSPLWSAIEKKKPQVLDVLLQAGADPNEAHPDHGLPILYTAEHNMAEETLILCRHGAIPNIDQAPSPLWIWIKNLTPQVDENNEWVFPDSQPILSLLKNGARIHDDDVEPELPSSSSTVRNGTRDLFSDEAFNGGPSNQDVIESLTGSASGEINTENSSAVGMNEIEFAKRQWLRYPLKHSDLQHVMMTLSLMERNLYAHTLSDQKISNDTVYKETPHNKM